MGQSTSNSATSHQTITSSKSRSISTLPPSHSEYTSSDDIVPSNLFNIENSDYSLHLPDECLSIIFQSLSSGDRTRCSLVCRQWLTVEGQSRHLLSLYAQAELAIFIPFMFSRFDSVTNLTLKCDLRSMSISDEVLILISVKCRKLTCLKLSACSEITDHGVTEFSRNCTSLKKFSCGSCDFGSKGINVLLINCSILEELSVKRLTGIIYGVAVQRIGEGLVASSLKVICLKDVNNGQSFVPLIIGSKNLRTLKLFECSGDWDEILQGVAGRVTGLVEVHLERLRVGDARLSALSNCSNIEILHLVKTPYFTDIGLTKVTEHCKMLRKLHIDGWKPNRISDEGLMAVAKNCCYLQELVLIGVNPTKMSLDKLALNCKNLEVLTLCGSELVGDPELCCIAEKCFALKKLCIKSCLVTDQGMEALAGGCPNLVMVNVNKCRLVTPRVVDWLRATRRSLDVKLDASDT